MLWGNLASIHPPFIFWGLYTFFFTLSKRSWCLTSVNSDTEIGSGKCITMSYDGLHNRVFSFPNMDLMDPSERICKRWHFLWETLNLVVNILISDPMSPLNPLTPLSDNPVSSDPHISSDTPVSTVSPDPHVLTTLTLLSYQTTLIFLSPLSPWPHCLSWPPVSFLNRPWAQLWSLTFCKRRCCSLLLIMLDND